MVTLGIRNQLEDSSKCRNCLCDRNKLANSGNHLNIAKVEPIIYPKLDFVL